jgi:hypothetical protein
MNHSKVVSRDEWLAARKQHLKKEKEFTRLRDKLSAERRELPWVKVENNYMFDGPQRDPRGPFRRAQPIERLSFHVRFRVGARLPELLVPVRSYRRHHDRYGD